MSSLAVIAPSKFYAASRNLGYIIAVTNKYSSTELSKNHPELTQTRTNYLKTPPTELPEDFSTKHIPINYFYPYIS